MLYNYTNSDDDKVVIISAMELEVLICKHNNPVKLYDITEDASTFKLSEDFSIAYNAAMVMRNIRNVLTKKSDAREYRRRIDLCNLHSELREIVVGSDVVCCYA